MAIQTDIFGSVRLTGEEAQKFHRQITYGRPNPAAQKSLDEGDELLSKFQQAGNAAAPEAKVKE